MNRRLCLTTLCAAPELAFAQHAAVAGAVPANTIWLNANESPEGPPEASRKALANALAEVGRYSHRAFAGIEQTFANAVGVTPDRVLLGCGSSQVLHCALQAFTGPGRAFVTSWPTWEMTAEISARLGANVTKVPLTKTWSPDVERMLDAAKRSSGGGLIHICNPNNPTSSMASWDSITWLAGNLPANTQLILDEAYLDYVEDAAGLTAVSLVKQDRPVIAARTFSKLYGLAGARIGFGCAPPELIARMRAFRENVVSILGARAGAAALELGNGFVAARRTARLKVRTEFCSWLRSKGLEYVPPHANFVLIHVRKPVAEVIPAMIALGVAPGRRFDSLDQWLRISIGTAADMEKVAAVLPKVLSL